MKVNVNGKPHLTEAENLTQLVRELSLPDTGIAVGVDAHIVKRSEWADFALKEGQHIVIIKAACGG